MAFNEGDVLEQEKRRSEQNSFTVRQKEKLEPGVFEISSDQDFPEIPKPVGKFAAEQPPAKNIGHPESQVTDAATSKMEVALHDSTAISNERERDPKSQADAQMLPGSIATANEGEWVNVLNVGENGETGRDVMKVQERERLSRVITQISKQTGVWRRK